MIIALHASFIDFVWNTKICAPHYSNYISSIEEFIDLFANADLVITSSFHGTAFALNFGIPLISIVSEGKGDDRQTTLLKSVGCENNAITVGFDIECIDATYDVDKVQKSLDTIRNENKKWISELIKAN